MGIEKIGKWGYILKNIAVIGYNIFSPGGTTRSNINLIKQFSEHNYNLIYFNEVEFTSFDVIGLKHCEGIKNAVQFCSLHEIEQYVDVDLYILTRETYFKLAKVLKKINPNCKVIGELHGPLPLIKVNLTPFLPFIDCVRVSTPSIKEKFMKKYEFDRVFVQTVSLHHIQNLSKEKGERTNNLLIYSRFDEDSKDIAYAIKLIAYIVHELGYHQIRLYINGYGNGEILYQKLVKYYGITDNVIINGLIPSNYIYLCTSKYETFGYSIVEAICRGKRAVLYCGDDHVVKENFSQLKTVRWLSKNLIEDGENVVRFLQSEPNEEDNELDIQFIKKMSENYVEYFLENIKKYSAPTHAVRLTKNEFKTILGKEKVTHIYFRKAKKMYRLSCSIPVVGIPLKSKYFKKSAFLMIDLVKKIVKRDTNISINENAFFVESFHGKNFSGDPKYLALAIQKEYPEAEIYVSSINDLVDMEIRSFGFTPIRFGSADYIQKFYQCKYIIINGNTIDSLKKQEGQVFIQTWHGFPFKRMVHDLKNRSQRKKETKSFVPRMMKWDYLLTASSFNTLLLSSAFLLDNNKKLKIIQEGHPKNEFLIANKDCETVREKLHLKYFHKRFPKNKKYILFCPTWRKGKRKQVTNIDLVELISKLPNEYDIIVKLHPNEGSLVSEYACLHDRIHCFYNELVDIQELYILSDILISDYSSAIFDYAHLEKKIIVLQEDSEQYNDQIGWYFNMERVCSLQGRKYSTEELIEEILEPNVSNYHKRIKNNLLTYDGIGSTKKILSKILKLQVE